jgi:hypothetical protein
VHVLVDAVLQPEGLEAFDVAHPGQRATQWPALALTGSTDLLMTDFGVTPRKAMLGMLETNPNVQIRLELLRGEIEARAASRSVQAGSFQTRYHRWVRQNPPDAIHSQASSVTAT